MMVKAAQNSGKQWKIPVERKTVTVVVEWK